jgi:hypothetical protein
MNYIFLVLIELFIYYRSITIIILIKLKVMIYTYQEKALSIIYVKNIVIIQRVVEFMKVIGQILLNTCLMEMKIF